jgi:hypothetical protein
MVVFFCNNENENEKVYYYTSKKWDGDKGVVVILCVELLKDKQGGLENGVV